MSKTRQRLAKVHWGCLRGLFAEQGLDSAWIEKGLGHFRSARSGVYMVLSLTESVIRFGFVGFWQDAHFCGVVVLLDCPA